MSDTKYVVEVVSPDEVGEILRRHNCGPENRSARRAMVLSDGFQISGEFSLTARSENGEVAWQHSEKNLITDYGRRQWMETRWHQAKIAFTPSLEAPQASRASLGSDPSQCFESSALTPTNTPATHTKTFSTTFGTPASNRTLGTIALCRYSGTAVESISGLTQVLSFALLTPPKTQTTVQTLEVVYRVSMNPIA